METQPLTWTEKHCTDKVFKNVFRVAETPDSRLDINPTVTHFWTTFSVGKTKTVCIRLPFMKTKKRCLSECEKLHIQPTQIWTPSLQSWWWFKHSVSHKQLFTSCFKVDLTKTVVSIMCQIESIVTSAAIIAWYIVALMYAATIILQVALINVWGGNTTSMNIQKLIKNWNAKHLIL